MAWQRGRCDESARKISCTQSGMVFELLDVSMVSMHLAQPPFSPRQSRGLLRTGEQVVNRIRRSNSTLNNNLKNHKTGIAIFRFRMIDWMMSCREHSIISHISSRYAFRSEACVHMCAVLPVAVHVCKGVNIPTFSDRPWESRVCTCETKARGAVLSQFLALDLFSDEKSPHCASVRAIIRVPTIAGSRNERGSSDDVATSVCSVGRDCHGLFSHRQR